MEDIILTKEDLEYIEKYWYKPNMPVWMKEELSEKYLNQKKQIFKTHLLSTNKYVCVSTKFNKRIHDEDFFEDGHGFDENTFKFANIICKYDINVNMEHDYYILLDESKKNTIRMESDEFDNWWINKISPTEDDYCTFIGVIFDLGRAF